MKKLLSIILALSFILCASMLSTVSAAETKLYVSTTDEWQPGRGKQYVYADDARNVEFYWKADGSGATYDWPVSNVGTLEEGTITATVSAAGNVGIFFGATGVKQNVEDGVNNLTGAADTKYCWVCLEVSQDGVAKLRFYYDDDAAGGAALSTHSDSNMPLNDTTANAEKYGIDGTSDIELKVEFTAEGKMTAYVNGEKVITRTPDYNNARPTFGTEYGILIRGASYGSEKANAEVGYVKSFSASAPSTNTPDDDTSSPDTGDFTSIYLVASAVILAATFAVVCVSRKKRIAE